MKKILLFVFLMISSVWSFGQTDVDVWRQSKFKIFSTRKFTFPKTFNSKSPTGKTILYEKLDHPEIKIETSSGKKWTKKPIIYKSNSDFGAISYDGKKWSGIYTEDGNNVSNLSQDKITTVKMDDEKFSYGEGPDAIFTPSSQNTPDISKTLSNDPNFYNPLLRVNKTCGVYVEVTNDLFKFWGNDTARVSSYVITIVTNVIALYDREGINVRLNKIYMWDTPDPYGNPFDNTQYLDIFTENISKNKPTTPESHFKHLLHNKNLGGIAWVNGVSDGYTTNPSIDPYYSCAVTGIGSNNLVNSSTTYSWPVMCFTHEMGHNLGSKHTHWCGWKNDTGVDIGRIDSCYRGESSDGPSNCGPQTHTITKLINNGSIMSYCHLGGQISFLTGFGRYPGYAIRSNLAGAPQIQLDGGSVPNLSTNVVTNIGTRTATGSGIINSEGGYPIQQFGVIWSTNPNNITFNLSTKTSITGPFSTSIYLLGVFSSTITGLSPNTKYWVRSYAKNSVGIAYGDTVSFRTLTQELPIVTTTPILSITQTTASSGHIIVNTGYNGVVTQRGVVWSTSPNPDVSLTTKTTQGSGGVGTTTTVSNITGLSANTTYYVRAYATSPTGTGYGGELSFTTLQNGIPSITSNNLNNNVITSTSFQPNAIIVNDGGSSVIERGFCMNSIPNVDITMNKRVSTGTSVGVTFNALYNNLLSKTNYYYKPYVITGNGTFYGTEVTVTTLPAVVSLDEVSGVESTKATFKYTITPPTSPPLVNSGIIISTNPSPSLSNRNFYFTSSYIQSGQSTIIGTDLLPNTTYYAIAVTTTSTNFVYQSNIISFTTGSVSGTPSVRTIGVISKTNNSLSVSGELISSGTSQVFQRGVCYSTSPNPTISNSVSIVEGGLSIFNATLSNLKPGIIYYFKAFATNKSGTSYGLEMNAMTTGTPPTLTTKVPTSISLTTANSGGIIINTGGSIINTKGVVWSTTPNPTINLITKTSDGSGSGEYFSAISGLIQNTKYYIRAYATTDNGVGYGNEIEMTTLPSQSRPTVITKSITNILPTSAMSGGIVTSDGGYDVTFKGICWSTNRNPTIETTFANGGVSYGGSGIGSFDNEITGLILGRTYYVRSFATNQLGTTYGNELSFTTSTGLPTVTTFPVISLTQNSASSGGEVISIGSQPVIERGVCVSVNSNPSISDTRIISGSGVGKFSTNIFGLSAETRYFVRAYATNTLGTSYGEQQSFVTLPLNSGSCQVSSISSFINQNIWNFKFNINPVCASYSVNLCRYASSDPNLQPSTTSKPVSCGVRNNMITYIPSITDRDLGYIQKIMEPQPTSSTKSGFGGYWYSLDVKCTSNNCFGQNISKYYFYVPGKQ